jgi:hypothetical protein
MASLFELEAPVFGGKALGGMTYAEPAATGTLTVAETVDAILETDQTGAITLTTPTAALIAAAYPSAVAGTSFQLVVINSGSNHNVTIEGGDGVTVVGINTIARYASKTFVGFFVSRTAIKLFGLGSVAAAQE